MDTAEISYLDAMVYCDRMEMTPREREFLWDVIKKLDQRYLGELARRRKPPPTSKTPPARR